MAFEGTLETFSIADILQLIGLQRKTGILTLKNKEEVVTVSFYNGMIVTADSVPKKLEDRLGKVLVKTGMISAEQLEEALNIQKKTLQKLGYILTKQGSLTPPQLKDALQVQVSQMIYRLFRWTIGEYHFDPHAKVDYDPENMAPMSAESILMEGIQMIDEWPLIQKRIPSFDIVYKKTVNLEQELGKGNQPQDISSEFDLLVEESIKEVFTEEKIQLNKEEEMVYRLVDGKRNVQQLIDSCPLTEFHTCKTLFELNSRNLIELVQREDVPAAPELKAFAGKGKAGIPVPAIGLTFLLVGLLSALINIFTPFGFFLSSPITFKTVVTTGKSAEKIIKLNNAIVVYYDMYHKMPGSLNDVVNSGIIKKSDVIDPWNKEYNYEAYEECYAIKGTDKTGKVRKELYILQFLYFMQSNDKVAVPKVKESGIQVVE